MKVAPSTFFSNSAERIVSRRTANYIKDKQLQSWKGASHWNQGGGEAAAPSVSSSVLRYTTSCVSVSSSVKRGKDPCIARCRNGYIWSWAPVTELEMSSWESRCLVGGSGLLGSSLQFSQYHRLLWKCGSYDTVFLLLVTALWLLFIAVLCRNVAVSALHLEKKKRTCWSSLGQSFKGKEDSSGIQYQADPRAQQEKGETQGTSKGDS